MIHKLLASGSRPTYAVLTFDTSSQSLELIKESPAPPNSSWLEQPRVKRHIDGKQLVYADSEDNGLVFALEIDDQGHVSVRGERKTHGETAHVHCLKDGSGVVSSNYIGGTVIFHPIEPSTGLLIAESDSVPLGFPYPYQNQEPPNKDRQEANHLHQVIEHEGGKLYCPDLGADRIWIIERREASGLEMTGWLQCPAGSGPRHAVISADGSHLYAIGEMSHNVFAFDLNDKSLPLDPIPHFSVNIIPPTVPFSHQALMDSAEILLHPIFSGTMYVSNRWELRIQERESHLAALSERQTGDAIAIILLSQGGTEVDRIVHVRTGSDVIRGMQITPDGKYAAVGGQEGGGIEIYEIRGPRGEEWVKVAEEKFIKGIKDFLWL
ncbi:hypothetical protein I302_103119 [Kwoniella bestiolae CBS 10118]|uniref:Isomerase YbhE n=1 Tax=Kwoniella bestiolae CBS 10118 TaxID=1296100 RepID=A0A1B9GGY9_9TREE|nr:hypothetical protein I302_01819 [Kwoniella bestiolae CBS 10118]OCF30300.1 hypothetical protein I302_01819 [Kwoniella bestiolae CBS 10118]